MSLWTTEEDSILRKYGHKVGGIDLCRKELKTKKFDRSSDAIRNRLKRLGNNKLTELTIDLSLLKRNPYVPNPRPKRGRDESLVIMLSDNHLGKLIKDQKGKVVFDLNTAQKRIYQVLERANYLIDNYLGASRFDEIVVIMGGDMMDNESIYDSQAHHIEFSVSDQFHAALNVYDEFLDELSKRKLPMRVVCCDGNHGRVSYSADEKTNWDHILYLALEALARKAKKNISFEISDLDFIVTDIKGQIGYIRHILPQSTQQGSAHKKFGGWHTMYNFDFACGGHYHTLKLDSYHGRPIFYNGSLCGVDDYAERLGLYDPPAQWIWGVSEKRPRTFSYAIDLV